MGIARANRLRQDKGIEMVFQKGIYQKSSFLALKYLKRQEGMPRIAISVGKRVSKKAVLRNKVRRRLREAVRPLLTELGRPYDIVIIASPEITTRSYQEIKSCVEELFLRAGLLTNINK